MKHTQLYGRMPRYWLTVVLALFALTLTIAACSPQATPTPGIQAQLTQAAAIQQTATALAPRPVVDATAQFVAAMAAVKATAAAEVAATVTAAPTAARTSASAVLPTSTLAAPAPTAMPPTATPPATSQPVAVVNAGELNVREGPGTCFAIINKVQGGDRLAITAKSSDAAWLLVRTPGGKEGWVSASLTRIEGDLGNTLVSGQGSVCPTPPPVAAGRGLIAYTVTEKFREVYKIYLMNADGSNQRLFANLASEPSFSPDGRQIIFYAWPGGLDAMNLDGSGRRHVVGDTEAAFPDWSPDGQWISFHSVRGRSSRFYVYVARSADGKDERQLADGEQATWGPDSRQLVYKGCLGSKCGLMFINLDGSGKRQLTDSANDGNPDWSADNNRIVFTSERDGNHEIYVITPGGSGLTRLTNHPAPDAMPVWLPGGQQIAFRSASDGNWGIYVMNDDGSGIRKVADARVDPNRWIWEKMSATTAR